MVVIQLSVKDRRLVARLVDAEKRQHFKNMLKTHPKHWGKNFIFALKFEISVRKSSFV